MARYQQYSLDAARNCIHSVIRTTDVHPSYVCNRTGRLCDLLRRQNHESSACPDYEAFPERFNT